MPCLRLCDGIPHPPKTARNHLGVIKRCNKKRLANAADSSFNVCGNHPMKEYPLRTSASRAFTLVELLVVIAIITILMGLLFPVVQTVKESARKTQAANDISQITGALKNYYVEYGMYPLTAEQVKRGQDYGYDTVYGDPNGTFPNDKLFDVLRNNTTGINAPDVASMNPKAISFLEIGSVKDPTNPKSGVATQAVTNSRGDKINAGAFVDPWGNQYVVFVDANYDGTITSNGIGSPGGGGPYWFYYPYTGTGEIRVSAGACSIGKDGKWGTNGNGMAKGSDDVITW